MELRNFDKLKPFIEAFDKGEIIYKDGALYRTIKRYNKYKEVKLEEPELMRFDSTRGYWRVSIRGIVCYEHIVVYAIHNGIDSLRNFECIDHIDTNKRNNNIENLEGVTIKENGIRASQKGLLKDQKGENNPSSKLSDEEIEKIRSIYKEGNLSQYKIAEMFGIRQSMVSRIVNNKRRS